MSKFTTLITLIAFVLVSCGEDESFNYSVPESYVFERNGESTVSYRGQTDRLNQVSEMKTYVSSANSGSVLETQILNDMFENTNGNGNGNFSFESSRKLEDKTFASDVADYRALFENASLASESANQGILAEPGVAGLISRADPSKMILVNEKGHEFTQFIEKGLMGSVFLNQIYNVYLTDERIGEGVDNEILVEGANYTAMEHHWDEAFGYFGVPVDFPASKTDRFWGNYCNSRDELLQTNSILMNAYLTGRSAIIHNDHERKNQSRDEIYRGFELVAAATTIHYINESVGALNDGEIGEAFHTMSEAAMFLQALKYNPFSKIPLETIQELLDSGFGQNMNFWNASATVLQQTKSTLISYFPELESIEDEL